MTIVPTTAKGVRAHWTSRRMLRVWVIAGVCACSESSTSVGRDEHGQSGSAAASIAGDAMTARGDDAVALAPADALIDAAVTLRPDAAVTPQSPRAPGIYPVLVVHLLDSGPHAYILACAHVINDKPVALLGPTACAKIIGTPNVEIVADDGTRVAVTLGNQGKGLVCPGDAPPQPWLEVTGLPGKRKDTMLLLPAGIAFDGRPLDRATFAALRSKHVVPPLQGSKQASEHILVRGQVDLDGDGLLEVITEHLGSVRLFRRIGTTVGEVGCQFI
jgi:hypothetical protein